MTVRSLAAPAFAGAVLVSGTALAAPAAATTWAVDTAKSTLGFTGQQSGAPFTGRFKTWTAAISFDPAHPETAQVLATVTVASATTDDAQKDEAMPGDDWFDASKFASATFQASGFTPKGGDAYEAKGKLSLRGITKDVDLPFTLTIAGNTAHAVGHATLVRTDFGVGQGAWTSGDTVALDVAIDLDLMAIKTP